MRFVPFIAGLFVALGCAALSCTSSSSSSTSAAGSGGSGGQGGLGAGGEGGAGGAGAGQPCDGTPEQWCGYKAYCDAPAGACPGSDVDATCALRPDDCTGEEALPTCACNGQIYINACEAYAVGVDVGPQEGCQPPQNPFACGPVLCEDGTTYCEAINQYSQCKPLPDACKVQGATCDCLKDVLCFAAPGPPMCEKDAEGRFFVSCTVTE